MRRDEALALAGRDAGFYFDFDGTLSGIQESPAAAVPVDGAPEALAELAGVAARVGVVSARPVDFLARHLPGLRLFGLYGLERRIPGEGTETDSEALEWLPAIEAAIEAARAELPPDVLVEDKRLSVGLHYRTAPALRDRVHAWAAARAASTGLRLQEGRMVAELKPPVDRDKGDVLRRERDGLSAMWYFGDDVADLRAFDALTSIGRPAVRVAVENAETDLLAKAADLTVPAPDDLVAFVREITARIRARPASA